MKIRMTKTLRSPSQAFDAGQELDLPGDEAKALIAAGAAQPVLKPAKAETAAAPAPETRRRSSNKK